MAQGWPLSPPLGSEPLGTRRLIYGALQVSQD